MSKVRRFTTRTLRDVELVFENEKGEREKEKFDVVYRSHSQKFLDGVAEAEQRLVDGKTIAPYSAYLGIMVVSITDKEGQPLTDDRSQPALKEVSGNEEAQQAAIAHNRNFFETMQVEDGTQILFNAIEEDVNPPKASPGPGPSGSAAAASEA